MDYSKLVKAALKARGKSHSPYSHFRVGAALLCENGKIYSGCNIENSSFSLTLCAERTALFKAYSEGERKFRAIAIASDSAQAIPPCGACRQVIQELSPGIDVILADKKGRFEVFGTEELLPHPFTKNFLK